MGFVGAGSPGAEYDVDMRWHYTEGIQIIHTPVSKVQTVCQHLCDCRFFQPARAEITRIEKGVHPAEEATLSRVFQFTPLSQAEGIVKPCDSAVVFPA